MKLIPLGWLLFLISSSALAQENQHLPENFVFVKKIIPDIILEMRYAGEHNFIGRPVEGYQQKQAILSKPAAHALCLVQEYLEPKCFGLKIFDAYRPQQAVDNFVKWSKKPADTLSKTEFYPELQKKNLFNLGYIASKSGHSRGSTVDLTLVNLQTGEEVDMGGNFDFFGKISHYGASNITAQQHENRKILRKAMEKFGFYPYSKEWWHFTLRNEPFPKTYFNFPVK